MTGERTIFEVKPIHLKLIRRLWIKWQENAYMGAPWVYEKKPYGNSNVLNDVLLEMYGKTDSAASNEEIQKAIQTHKEIGTALQVVTSSGCFFPGIYEKENEYGNTWVYQKYINCPKNLDEAVRELQESLYEMPPEVIEEYKNASENDAVAKYHHSAGRGTRNDFGLWDERSPLHVWFVSHGIAHADDMSAILFKSLHRTLNDKDIDLEGQIKFYQDYWSSKN
jgi:hypothetical protein